MRYFKLIYYTNADQFDTHEVLLDENAFRRIQKALENGVDFLHFKDRSIKRGMIKEIGPADDIIEEYRKQGILPDQLDIMTAPPLSDLDSGMKKLT